MIMRQQGTKAIIITWTNRNDKTSEKQQREWKDIGIGSQTWKATSGTLENDKQTGRIMAKTKYLLFAPTRV